MATICISLRKKIFFVGPKTKKKNFKTLNICEKFKKEKREEDPL